MLAALATLEQDTLEFNGRSLQELKAMKFYFVAGLHDIPNQQDYEQLLNAFLKK